MKRVGFIGLGIMGRPMAKNLHKAGFPLVIVGSRSKAAVEELRALGAKVVGAPREVAQNADVIITCLPDSPDVEHVVTGPGGILDGVPGGTGCSSADLASGGQPLLRNPLIVIDMSTIAPSVVRRVAAKAAERGVRFLDAPVSGGQKGAIEGTLSIMAGGDAKALEEATDVLKAMGKKIVHCGPSGAGSFTKLANQIICAVTWQAIAEGLVLGAKAGVDPAKMVEAVSAGAARCWALEVRVPEVLKRNFKAGFMAKLQHKDLNIALAAGKEVGAPLPVTAIVNEFYRALITSGGQDLDTSALVTVTEKLAGVEVRQKN